LEGAGEGQGSIWRRHSQSRSGHGGRDRLCHHRPVAVFQDPYMSRLDSFSGKTMDLAGQVGDNLRGALPDGAGKWLQTGAAIGVAKTGTRVFGSFVRRNPAVIVAAAVGAGAAWYAVHRYRRKQQANGGG